MHLHYSNKTNLLVWWYIHMTRFFCGGPQFESRRTRLFFLTNVDRAILAAHVLEVLGVALCRLPGPIHLRAFRDSFACIRDAACHSARAMAAQGWSGRHNGEGIRSMEGVSEGGCRKPKPQSPYPKGPLVRAPVHQARPTGGTSPPPIQARASPV